jgi:hypothetical protein
MAMWFLKNGLGTLLVVLETGTGLRFIAIVIGYLPVLYQFFARREEKVIMLDAVAGSPPSFQARLTFSTARQAVIEMGRVFQAGAVLPDEERLPAPRLRAVAPGPCRGRAGLHFADEDDIEQKLADFRNTYEPFVNGLARYLVFLFRIGRPRGAAWTISKTILGAKVQNS